MAQTRNQLITALRQLITDPLNRQNTAQRVKTALEAVINNSYNLADDGALAAGSIKWQPGGVGGSQGYKAGQFLRNAIGVDFYYLADILNPQVEPLLAESTNAVNALVKRLAPGNTDGLTEGPTNLFFTNSRAVSAVLTDYVKAATARAVAATDSILIALGLLEKKADDNAAGIATKEATANKGIANGYASLDAAGKIPATEVPNTDSVQEGPTNLYFTNARAIAAVLTGYVKAATARAVAATDSVLVALGLLEKRADDNAANTGTLSTLTTTIKTSIVAAINEIVAYVRPIVVSTNFYFSNKVGAPTGTSTTLMGVSAGAAVTSGSHNTLIGANAGNAITTSANNTIIGSQAGMMLANTGAANNVMIGYLAGSRATTATGSVFIGFYSGGVSQNTASANTFVGNTVGLYITSGSNNSFFGSQSGYNVTTGGQNTFVGNTAGSLITTGRTNTFVGNNAGGYTATGINNTSIGAESGQAVDLGGLNNTTAIGYNCLVRVSNTVIIGDAADTGNKVGIGTTNPMQKLEVNGRIRTTGIVTSLATNQTFLGYSAGGIENVSAGGDGLTFIGSSAGRSNSTNNQTMVGVGAGANTTTGGNNTLIGCNAGQNNTTGQNNVMLGHLSGRLAATGSQNTFAGSLAGQTTTGDFNTFLGFNAGSNNTTGGSNIAIGNAAGPATAALVNTVAIGNGALPTASNTLLIADTLNSGFGVLAPTSKIAARGLIESTTGGFKFPDGTIQATAASGTAAPTNTDGLAEGTTNLYFTNARAIAAVLTGYVKAATTRAIAATDSILTAIGLLEKKADDNTGRITVLETSSTDLKDYRAYRITANRSRIYYTKIGTATGAADDAIIQALAESQPGDLVYNATPVTNLPLVGFYAPILVMRPGTTLALNGFPISTVDSQDCISFSASGNYTLLGGGSKIMANGAGSVAISVGSGKVVIGRYSDVNVEYRGSGNALLAFGGIHTHTGSLYIENLAGAWPGYTNLSYLYGDTNYDFVGDIRVNGSSSAFGNGGTSVMAVRSGRLTLITTNSILGDLFESAKLNLVNYTVDLSQNPTAGGLKLHTATNELILTDVSVIGGAIVSASTVGTVRLRGSTVLPAAYGLAYLRGLGLTVVDERPPLPVLYLPNVSAVPAAPASGGILFVDAGVLKYIGSGGTVTTIAPPSPAVTAPA